MNALFSPMEAHHSHINVARQRFFEEGQSPDALVNKTLLRSWERCVYTGLHPTAPSTDNAAIVTAAALIQARERNRQLIEHAQCVMDHVFDQIRNSGSVVVLADANGLLLHSVGDPDFLERADKAALRPGAQWDEDARGTNAVGTALVEQTPVEISGAEHFLDSNSFLTCSAAPLADPQGRLIGVLDISGDYRAYQRHSLGLVRVSAQMIEKRMFKAEFGREILVGLHPQAEYVGSLAEGLMAFSPDGQLMGMNPAALSLLGVHREAMYRHTWDSLFETSLPSILERVRRDPQTLTSLISQHGQKFFVRLRGELPSVATSRFQGSSSKPLTERHDSAPSAPHKAAPARTGRPHDLESLETHDPTMKTAIDKARRMLGRDIPLLIQGESGAGKEMFAKAFHLSGPRHNQPFIALNCAAIPDTLIESELFGYQGGAFTGARKEGAVGKIQQAHGGTLFLDEIGDMPLNLQARLLRVLQERCVTPLGSTRSVPVDISLVCATHRKLKEEVRLGRFREDLYYRLNGLSITLPALRDRHDLAELVERLVKIETGTQRPVSISPSVMQVFHRYAWPGNIRQLHNVIRVAVALLEDGESQIREQHLPEDLLDDLNEALPLSHTQAGSSSAHSPASPSAAAASAPVASMPTPPVAPAISETRLDEIERQAILTTLEQLGGNISAAARQLGVSRNTLYRKLGRL